MSLHVILGPMFSGKTTKILEIYERCIRFNIPVMVINHSNDTRYSDNMLSTHNKKMIPCIFTDSLYKLNDDERYKELLNNTTFILINEGQFFGDLYDWTLEMVEKWGKKVCVCGLDGDSNRNKFGQLLDLIPVCDKVTKLRSLCMRCKISKKAPFTLRTSNNSEQVLVGSNDCYMPVCRECYETRGINMV